MENAMLTAQPDRKMWFSMWFLGSIVTFGLGFFPLFHSSIERRNQHFLRQEKLESQLIKNRNIRKSEVGLSLESLPRRNARAWAGSIVLIVPAFLIAYHLSRDLRLHEKHQELFLSKFFPEIRYAPQNIAVEKYLLITLLTLGFGLVYWLYKVFNFYNSHFKEHMMIEEQIKRLMEKRGLD